MAQHIHVATLCTRVSHLSKTNYFHATHLVQRIICDQPYPRTLRNAQSLSTTFVHVCVSVTCVWFIFIWFRVQLCVAATFYVKLMNDFSTAVTCRPLFSHLPTQFWMSESCQRTFAPTVAVVLMPVIFVAYNLDGWCVRVAWNTVQSHDMCSFQSNPRQEQLWPEKPLKTLWNLLNNYYILLWNNCGLYMEPKLTYVETKKIIL